MASFVATPLLARIQYSTCVMGTEPLVAVATIEILRALLKGIGDAIN